MRKHTEYGVDVDINFWRASRLIGIITALLIVIGGAAYVLRWQSAALDTVGPERIRALSREANDRHQALQAQLATIHTQQQRLAEFDALYGKDRAVWPQGKRDEYQQLSSATRNLVSAHNGACGQYAALWLDEWRDVPAPNDLPRACPLIAE